jgi:hypothetical protein
MTAQTATQCLLPLPGFQDDIVSRPKRRRRARRQAQQPRTLRPQAERVDTTPAKPGNAPTPAAHVASAESPAARHVDRLDTLTTPRRTRPAFGGVIARGRDLLTQTPAESPRPPVARREARRGVVPHTIVAIGAALWSGIAILFLGANASEQPGARPEPN